MAKYEKKEVVKFDVPSATESESVHVPSTIIICFVKASVPASIHQKT